MTQAAIAFKYTFPIAKAEQRSDGAYIVGYASGPEIDTDGERMTPEAIELFSKQINEAPDGEKLVYRDAHAPDGVLRDLGDITKAWVDEHFHLGIEVKLNTENPAAAFLFKSIQKGKQYGMSVAGRVIDYTDEYVTEAAMVVRTFKNVALDEISNTTRPAWYPSFGTVLSKSVKDASVASSGDNNMGDNANEDLLDTPIVEDATATKSDDAAPSDDADTTEKAAEVVESVEGETTEKADEAPVADETTEKAGRKLSGATSAKLLGMFNTMQAELLDLGVLEAPAATAEIESEKSASDTEEDTVEKTDDTEATAPVVEKSEHDALVAELQKANERIAALEARPATALPGLVTDETKKAASDELADLLAKASPSDRVRLAFAAYTGGK